jgi:hypothetical protein
MRFLIRVLIPTEAGNKMIKDPNFVKNIEGFVRDTKAEAAYFTEVNGDRVAIFIADIQSADKIPSIAEPFFMMGAKVEFHPTMVLDDLKKGLASASIK